MKNKSDSFRKIYYKGEEVEVEPSIESLAINPDQITKLSKEELIQCRMNALNLIDDYDAMRKQIDSILLEKIDMNGEVIGDYAVKPVIPNTFAIDLIGAKELGATKKIEKEVIDNEALKKLSASGVKIPMRSAYLRVDSLEDIERKAEERKKAKEDKDK